MVDGLAPASVDTAGEINRPLPVGPFPEDASVREKLHHLLCSAVLAPSSHNTQPWRFRLHDDHVTVHADYTRRLSIVDPEGRALVISCGAAIETLVVAARRYGYLGEVDTLPEPDNPGLLARVGIGGSYDPTTLDRDMFNAIATRTTYRFPFDDRPPPDYVIDDLSDACRQLGTDVRLFTSQRERQAIAELVAEGDRQQFSDPEFRAELTAWIHPKRMRSGDGMASEVFGIPDFLTGIGAFAIRTFDIGDQQAARDRSIAEHSPTLMVLITPTDQVVDWIACGRALASLLLTISAHGLAASYLNQPIEVPDVRRKLASHFTMEGMPQLLLRLGYPTKPVAATSARRPLEDVLDA